MLDLPYVEDSRAEVDMNVVICRPTVGARFVEVQGTAEGTPFTRGELDDLLDLAELGIAEIVDLQREYVAVPPTAGRRRTRPGLRREASARLSSANPDKVAEIAALVGGVVDLLPRPPRWPTSWRTPTRSRRMPVSRPRPS